MADRMIQLCQANFPLCSTINTVQTTGLWLQLFKNTADDVFETAVRLSLLTCKTFPTVADIRKAIDELRQEINSQPKPAMIARSRKVNPATAAALQQASEGKAKELISSVDVSDLMDFARCKFPNISEQAVRNNLNEILAAKEDADRCFVCRYQPGQCMTNGYFIKPLMMPNGWVKNEYAKCLKKREVS